MGKNRKTQIARDFKGNGRKIQYVLNAPRFIKQSYISPKGRRLLFTCEDGEIAAMIVAKYTKNRLIPNPECTHVVKIIIHNK